MADYLTQLGDFSAKLASSKRVLLALSKNLSVDSLASALAMALTIQKMGKTVSVVSEGTPLVSHSHLYGVGDIKNTVPTSGEGNFVIKLDGVVDPSGQMNTVPALEKLDWNPEGSALNLVFHVVPGQRFEPTNVTYGHETSGFDLIITVDADSLDELGQIYLKNAALFSKSTIVNIDNEASNSQFGNINIVDPQASSLSEMTVQILKQIGVEMDGDIASNLVAGIYTTTHNLTQNVNPDTFVAVATAMQAGGKLPEGGVVGQQSAVSDQPSANPALQVPVVESAEAQSETNQIQFNNLPSAVSDQPSANPALQIVEPPVAVAPQPVVNPEPVQAQVQPAVEAPVNDLYSNPFLNPGGQAFSQPAADVSTISAQSSQQITATPAPQAPATPANDPFGAPASGPTFNFGSFGDSQQSAVSDQSSANSVPQVSVVSQPAPVQEEKVDVSGLLNTIQQANKPDSAYDLKQIFNVEQMPETPIVGNTTHDSAVVQPSAVSDQPTATPAQQTPVAQVLPVQDSKPQSSPEEQPAGEAVMSSNPEVEANPTPDWLVPKIFKGGSLG
jgi:hypothetical protein